MRPPFFLRDFPSDSVLELLDQSVLGTNGARYKHLNTREIIGQLDNPLFLSLERNQKALSNITFCRRGGNWYIRYFAFAAHLQSSKKERSGKESRGELKKLVEHFFKEKLQSEVNCFYSYVDPNNAKSKWMCENFGFTQIGTLATQSFSRRQAKKAIGFELLDDPDEIRKQLKRFENHLFFSDYTAKRVKFAAIRNENDEIAAFVKYQSAHWRIDSLPGKLGRFLVKIIPYLPILSGVFNPKNHRFIVSEAVYVANNDPQLLTLLFESVLAQEKHNLLLWWIDERESLWQQNRNKVKWGIFHRLLKNPPVNVYARFEQNDISEEAKNRLIYVSGMDLI